MKNALSVDVEDYFHVTGFEHLIDRARWDEYPVRFQIGLGRILEILDRHDVKPSRCVCGLSRIRLVLGAG